MKMIKAKLTKMPNVPMRWRTELQNIAAAVVSLAVLSWIRLRPIGLFFLALFFFWLYKTRCTFEIKLTTESRKKYKILKQKMITIKKDYPKLHLICFATAFGAIAIAGTYMMGMFLPICFAFNVLTISFLRNFVEIKRNDDPIQSTPTTPHEEATSDNNDLTSNSTSSHTSAAAAAGAAGNVVDDFDDDVEEFVPETNKANLAILEKASEFTSPTEDIDDDDADDRSDDIPSELLIHDTIPEINENSTDDDDELIPVLDMNNPHTQSLADSQMHFKKGHFKENTINQDYALSSSSSEESLSKGLHFPDHNTVVDGAASTRRDQQMSSGGTAATSTTAPVTTIADISSIMTVYPLSNIIGGLTMKWLTTGGGGGEAAVAAAVVTAAAAGAGAGADVTRTAAAAAVAAAPSARSKLPEKEIELNSDTSSQESEFEFLDNE